MSLRPDERSGRGRSSSTSGRERERSRSNVRYAEAPEPPSASSRYPPTAVYAPSSSGYDDGTSPYEVRSPEGRGDSRSDYFPSRNGSSSHYGQPSSASMPYPPDDFAGMPGGLPASPPQERPTYRYAAPSDPAPARRSNSDLAYGYDDDRERPGDRLSRHTSYSSKSEYKYTPKAAGETPAPQPTYKYAEAPQKVTYTSKPQSTHSEETLSYTAKPQNGSKDIRYSIAPQGQYHEQLPRSYPRDPYEQEAQIVDITPGRERPERSTSYSHTQRLSIGPEQPGLQPSRSSGLGPRVDRLSISGHRPDLSVPGAGGGGGGGHGLPPPSPLLEAYHGTYQSISPMPFAMKRYDDDDELDALEPLETLSITTSRTSQHSRDKSRREDDHGYERLEKDKVSKEKRRVVLYDAEADAKTIASALNHHKPEADPICDILPRLSHDQIMELRKEYKKQVKVQGKGVNLSKHVKTKITGNFGKAVYVTTLGRWESEGYWANFWYQSHGSRRELLIESLMGRTNAEVRMIEDDFKDKRYSDSLRKCMEKELKMDKFRTAVLMALEGRRQEEQDVYPQEYVIQDVETLYRIMHEPKGGETAMLEIIIRRSDAHLREVLKAYESIYHENFARVALKRSNNLVGEVIAHILNGAINKPARDALLLQHAIRDIAEKNRDDELRYELLVSRLVRMHWDKLHMARVQREYYDKYRITLPDAIAEATKGDFCEYMCELCETK